ncbi:3976_t:CDS:1, partial [Funneliformis geosporum]
MSTQRPSQTPQTREFHNYVPPDKKNRGPEFKNGNRLINIINNYNQTPPKSAPSKTLPKAPPKAIANPPKNLHVL